MNQGIELVPIYKVRSLFGRSRTDEDRARMTARCPSAPNWDYAPRQSTVSSANTVAGDRRRPQTIDLLPLVSGTPGQGAHSASSHASRTSVAANQGSAGIASAD
jgi:hypothetical protein